MEDGKLEIIVRWVDSIAEERAELTNKSNNTVFFRRSFDQLKIAQKKRRTPPKKETGLPGNNLVCLLENCQSHSSMYSWQDCPLIFADKGPKLLLLELSVKTK